MRIVLLGPPASGKGTQAAMISEMLNVPTVSTGALLRAEKANGTEIGKAADLLTREGRMVPDELMNSLIESWLTHSEGKGFILDGFPRTIPQAEAFDRMLVAHGIALDAVLFLDLSLPTIRKRVEGRLVCSVCANSVNLGLHVQTAEEPCPKCGGKLIRRSDDNMEALEQRLQEYVIKTEPLVEFYREEGLLRHIVGEGHPKPVFQQIQEGLGLRLETK